MKVLSAVLSLGLPALFRRQLLRRLISATAGAFDVEPISTRGLSAGDLLRDYALFTRAEAERLWEENRDESAVERRLFDNAREIGAGLRRDLRLRTREDVLRLSRVLYRALGIEFSGLPDGTITISECAFSRFYTSRVCRLISALDAGVAAGLSAGGDLAFSQRITDGHACCRARLTFKE